MVIRQSRPVEWVLLAIAVVVAGGAILLATGTFRSDPASSSASAQACGIVASGQKLCGGDLAAYCHGFERGSLDQQTVFACSQVGVDVVK